MNAGILLSWCFLVMTLVVSQAQAQAMEANRALAKLGKSLFQSRGCVFCHAIGKGNPTGPDLSGVTDRRTHEWLVAWLKDPTAMLGSDTTAHAMATEFHNVKMPNMHLGDLEVEALIQYMATEKPRHFPGLDSSKELHAEPLKLRAAIDHIVRATKWGNLAFGAPDSMYVGEAQAVRFLVNPSAPVDSLRLQLAELGRTEGAQVQLYPRMIARLSGPNFDISAVSADTQAVTATGNTEWKWWIRAHEPGSHALDLTLNALVRVEGSTTPHEVRRFERKIKVRITMAQRAADWVDLKWFWKSVIAIFVLSPLIAFRRKLSEMARKLLQRRKLRKKAKN